MKVKKRHEEKVGFLGKALVATVIAVQRTFSWVITKLGIGYETAILGFVCLVFMTIFFIAAYF